MAEGGYAAFIKIDGAPGDATDSAHKDWSEVESFTFEIETPQTGGGLSGGVATFGDVFLKPVVVNKKMDKSSPELFFACCKGKVFKEVTIEQLMKSGGDTMQKIYSLKLSNARITQYEPGAGREILVFAASKMDFVYTSVGPDGRPKGTVTHWWDMATNKGG